MGKGGAKFLVPANAIDPVVNDDAFKSNSLRRLVRPVCALIQGGELLGLVRS